MPIYEYRCEPCSKTHEIMQKFSDPLVKECPDCLGPVEKIMSLSAFSLKGTGWYTTDYKTKSSAKATTSESKESKTEAPCSSSDSSKSTPCGQGSCSS